MDRSKRGHKGRSLSHSAGRPSIPSIRSRRKSHHDKHRGEEHPEIPEEGNKEPLPCSPGEGQTGTKEQSTTATRPSPGLIGPSKRSKYAVCALLITPGILLSVVIFLVVTYLGILSDKGEEIVHRQPRFVSQTIMGSYKNWVAVTGAVQCQHVPRKIFDKNGTIGDAAVATTLCICTVMPHRCGMGGSSFVTYYNRRQKKAYAINSRCRAPDSATRDMFFGVDKLLSVYDGKAVAVFGDLQGYDLILNTTGRNLQWRELFDDAIKYAREGFTVYEEIHKFIVQLREHYSQDGTVSDILSNRAEGRPLAVGETLKNVALAHTLTNVSIGGPNTLSRPPYAQILAKDIQKKGGIIKAKDFETFRPTVEPPLTMDLSGGLRLFAVPLPAGGTVASYIINIIDKFVQQGQLPDTERTMHFIVEAFKFAFARRAELGDPMSAEFDTIPKKRQQIYDLVKNLTSRTFAEEIKKKIGEDTVSDPTYYGLNRANIEDHGSGQLAIIAPNGDALVMVSSINTEFGALFVSPDTGIWMNNEMDDFSTAYKPNTYNFVAATPNYIWPRKRAMSSLTPIIVVDAKGDVVLAASTTGSGTMSTGIAQVVSRILWMGHSVKEAIDCGRCHTQLIPDKVSCEKTADHDVVAGLKRRKHNVTTIVWDGNVIVVAKDMRLKTLNGSHDYRTGAKGGMDGD